MFCCRETTQLGGAAEEHMAEAHPARHRFLALSHEMLYSAISLIPLSPLALSMKVCIMMVTKEDKDVQRQKIN